MWRWPPHLGRHAPLPVTEADPVVAALAERIETASQARLGRSLVLFHLSAGDCGGCGMEVQALQGPPYDLEPLGLRFTTSPRHADVLLMTGVVTRAMHGAVLAAWDAMPGPKWLVALGDCADDGGLFRDSYAVQGGVGAILPVDLVVRGCPPSPAQVLAALHALVTANAPEARFP